MFKQAVIKPVSKRQEARTLIRHDLDRDDIERINIFKAKISSPDLPSLFPVSAQCFKQDEFRTAEAGIGQQPGNQGWVALIRRQRDDPRAMMQMWPQQID